MGTIPSTRFYYLENRLLSLEEHPASFLWCVCGREEVWERMSAPGALIIKDGVCCLLMGILSLPPRAFSETMELSRPRLYRGQKVIVTQTFLMKSVFVPGSLPPFCSDSLHSGLIYEGFFFSLSFLKIIL